MPTNDGQLTNNDLAGRVNELEDRVDELEAENQQLRSLIEFRGAESEWKNLWIGGHPLGSIIHENKRGRIDHDRRLTDLEAGEVDITNLTPSDDQLPIQQYTAVRKAEGRDAFGKNETNLYRATYVWSQFQKHSTRADGRLKLSSSQVRNILRDTKDGPGMDNVNANTVKRVMQALAKYSTRPSKLPDGVSIDDPDYAYHPDLLLTFRDDSTRNMIWADAEEWDNRMQGIEDAAADTEPATEDDAYTSVNTDGDPGENVDTTVFEGEPVTSPGEDTVGGTLETTDP